MLVRAAPRPPLVPVAPTQAAEKIDHAVLGVVEAAKYLGLRRRADPARARAYAELMVDMHGRGHDA